MKAFGLFLATAAVLLQIAVINGDATRTDHRLRAERDVRDASSRQSEEFRRVAENRNRIIERQSPDRRNDMALDRRERERDERRMREERREDTRDRRVVDSRRVRENEERTIDRRNDRIVERRERLSERRTREPTEHRNTRMGEREVRERTEDRRRDESMNRREEDVSRRHRNVENVRFEKRQERFALEEKSVLATPTASSAWPMMKAVIVVMFGYQLLKAMPEKNKNCFSNWANSVTGKLKAF